jgi:hypothetical protein
MQVLPQRQQQQQQQQEEEAAAAGGKVARELLQVTKVTRSMFPPTMKRKMQLIMNLTVKKMMNFTPRGAEFVPELLDYPLLQLSVPH